MKNIADPARNKRSPFTTFAESLCSAWQEEAPTGCPPTGNVLRKVGVGLSTLQACRGNQRGKGALMNALTSSVFSPGSTGSICAFFRISYDNFDSLMHIKTVVAPNHCFPTFGWPLRGWCEASVLGGICAGAGRRPRPALLSAPCNMMLLVGSWMVIAVAGKGAARRM